MYSVAIICVEDTEPSQLRRALPSVEHFVFCHPDSSLLNTAVFCTRVYIAIASHAGAAVIGGRELFALPRACARVVSVFYKIRLY